MSRWRSKYQAALFGMDALLSIGFGAVSWLSPVSTYGTIVDLSDLGAASRVTWATLSGLSVFYVVMGLVCLCATLMPAPHSSRLAFVMLARHAWVGVQGYRDIGQEWIVGNPWPDIVIHAAFVLSYSVLIGVVWRRASR